VDKTWVTLVPWKKEDILFPEQPGFMMVVDAAKMNLSLWGIQPTFPGQNREINFL
jgi:hypothetical protein